MDFLMRKMKKRKWTNKGIDKQEDIGSLLHNTTSQIQDLYKIQYLYKLSKFPIFYFLRNIIYQFPYVIHSCDR